MTNGEKDTNGGTEFSATKTVNVSLQSAAGNSTADQALWTAIRNRGKAITFARYSKTIECVFCKGNSDLSETTNSSSDGLQKNLSNWDDQLSGCVDGTSGKPATPCGPSFHGSYAYDILKLATQAFLLLESGIIVNGKILDTSEESGRWGEQINADDVTTKLTTYLGGNNTTSAAPYLKGIVNAILGREGMVTDQVLPYCQGVLMNRFTCPSLIELIWSYWQEEGMLVQTMNAISLRFQNRRSSNRDPLANLEIDPLRPLNNLLWGFIQDEQHRLTVPRRAYEYDHHYGLKLVGKSVPRLDSADSRSKFIEAFHNLLYRTSMFYQEEADTTMKPDGFPLLNGLKEVHLLLAEGAHNQFGDLPWTSRVEMLIMQWLLARPEMREFLRGRHMVPYTETWMGTVDAMKKLQGWTDTSVTHFRDLAVFGEQVLLSIRYGDWSKVNDQDNARNWARYWRPEIQGYMHSYHATTGIDLTAQVTDSGQGTLRFEQPSLHLSNRLAAQQGGKSLPPPSSQSEFSLPRTRQIPKVGHRRLPHFADKD